MPSLRARAFNALLRLTSKHQMKGDLSVEAIRKQMASTGRLLDRSKAVSKDLEADHVTVTFQGDDSNSRTLLYLHGGAFCSHAPDLYDKFVGRICRRIDAAAYVPDYRLAPEHPFPAAVDDCLHTYKWLLEKGTDPSRMVIAGDSAGGYLVLTTLQRARDEGLPLPACAVLLSAASDMTATSNSYFDNEDADPVFTAKAMTYFRRIFIPEHIPNDSPLVSPLLGEFHDFPNMLLQVGSTEMLLDDTLGVARKVKEAGGEAQTQIWEGMPHVFQVASWLPEAKDALDKIKSFVESNIP